MSLKPPSTPRLEHEDTELVRQEHERKLVELQGLPMAGARVLAGIKLVDGKTTMVAHGLGRPAAWVRESAPRAENTAAPIASTGRVVEVREGGVDRSKYVALVATGWGVDIVVDVLVL